MGREHCFWSRISSSRLTPSIDDLLEVNLKCQLSISAYIHFPLYAKVFLDHSNYGSLSPHFFVQSGLGLEFN